MQLDFSSTGESKLGKLVAMVPVWNEERGFLRKCLKDLSEYVDEIVILDDASTDGTVKLCKSFSKVIVHVLPQNLGQIDKGKMRRQLYDLAVARNPTWFIALDSDEILENRFKTQVREMMEALFNWYSFYRVDFWTRDEYFVSYSSKMKSLRLMFRYMPNKSPNFLPMKIHGARSPAWVLDDPSGKETDIRIKHFGFIRKEDRMRRIILNKKFNQITYVKQIEAYEQKPLLLHKWIE